MIILDGRKARDFYKTKLIERVQSFVVSHKIAPKLAIIQIGDNKDSSIYIEQKKKFGIAIGAMVDHIKFPEKIGQEEVAKKITELNTDKNVHGIIIQLPIPAHLDKMTLINMITPLKDVDGLTDSNQKMLDLGTPRIIPATAKGVMLLLDFYNIECRDKSVVVFGRSRLVGHPIAELMKIRGAKVSVIHSQTSSPEKISRGGDVVIVAIGKKGHIGTEFIKQGAVVVDVGTSGDVDHDAVSGLVSAISPVPGGVGPMTVLSLFDNLVVSAENA